MTGKVYRNQYYVVRQQVYLLGPTFQAGIAFVHQLRIEESVESVHFREILVSCATVHYHFQEEICNLKISMFTKKYFQIFNSHLFSFFTCCQRTKKWTQNK